MGKLEKIEQIVKAKVQEKYSLLTCPSDAEINKIIQDVYLDNLESETLEKHPPMYFLDFEGNKKYARLRNIILTTFALLESKIDRLLTIKIDRTYTELPSPYQKESVAINIILENLNFTTKLEALEVLYGEEKINIRFLIGFGKIRNAFAHCLRLGNKKYLYKKKNVSKDLYALQDLIERVNEIIDKLDRIIEKQPEKIELKKNIDNFIENKRKLSGNKNVGRF